MTAFRYIINNFFGHNISKWIQPFKLSAANHVTAKQAAALGNWDSVDQEKLDFNRSRAIFNAMLQLFVTGDEITNERLETDYGSPEALSEFGIWIGRPTDNIGFPRNPEYVSNDTLFLEPAGYIPYYAKIKTYDTVGLASPEIKKYREKDKNNRWWLDFIEEKKPTFILDRSNLYGDFSHDGEYTMSSSERIWFKNNYKLVKEYNYHNYVEQYSGSLEQFYKLGNHAPYFLYKRVK